MSALLQKHFQMTEEAFFSELTLPACATSAFHHAVVFSIWDVLIMAHTVCKHTIVQLYCEYQDMTNSYHMEE